MKPRVFIGILSGVAIVLSIFAVCMNISEDIVVNNVSIVLGFIGVLATFIVVSNAVQLWKMEQQIKKCYDDNQSLYNKINEFDNSNKGTIEKVNVFQKAMSNNWNNMKHIVLTAVHQEFQYLNDNSKEVDKNKHLNLAFLYLIDIVPLLTHLYGSDGEGKDESSETLAVMMRLFQNIIDKETAGNDNLAKISRKNLEKCLKYFQIYFPKDYYNLEYVKTIIHEIEKRIKEYDMNN